MTRGFPFPVSYLKPRGQAFEDNRNVIWSSWLMDDKVSTIGIYGMRGIGKTRMLQQIVDKLLLRQDISHHVYWVTRMLQQIVDKLLLRQDISHHVYWVTVPRDFSIHNLQNLIAKRLDLDLSSEYDILPRAEKLSKELMKKQKWILILDDLWESFEPSAVGIPVPLKGCKVIFTTRSVDVCHGMGSQVITEVTRLSEREAWTLFMETLGHGIALSPEVERIAVDIVRECAGLPLGIITMAACLRGVDDQDEWRHTLEKLKESNFGDMEDKVFRVLRISYDRLDDFALQQSLLYCALFPEGHAIEREELIYYLIDEGIIRQRWSREAAFDKGHEMLDTLENVGLLQRIDGGRAVKMHDLIRDMAVCICKESPSVMGQRRKTIILKKQHQQQRQENVAGDEETHIVLCLREQRRKGIEMAVSKIDPFWNHVELTNANSILKCKFCEYTFGKGTPLSSIKLHFSGEEGRCVSICRLVPKQVQEADFHKTMRQRRKRIDDSEQEQNNVGVAQQQEPESTGEFERAKDLNGGGIERPRDTPDELKKLEGSKCRDMVDFLKSGWTLLMTNLILEMASAVFDQLDNALVGMVLAFVALLLSTAELIYMARKERMSLLPIFLRPSTTTLAPGKPGGTIVEYFGLVGAVWQCFYSTVAYAYARQKRENPIKMSLLPFIFLLCVVISKLIKK